MSNNLNCDSNVAATCNLDDYVSCIFVLSLYQFVHLDVLAIEVKATDAIAHVRLPSASHNDSILHKTHANAG
eukprot:768740-Hanusia_phi.AAC.4